MKQNLLLFAFGVIFIALLVYVSITYPSTISQYFGIYKTILAISCAGIAAMVPGFFQLRYKGMIRAGGALGVFTFVVLFVEPNKEFFSVRVVLNDIHNNQITEKGKITMVLGSEQREMPVLNQNDALFENIPIRYLNTSVKLNIDFTENYVLAHPDSGYKLLENQLINLQIKLKLQTLIQGIVMYDDKPLSGVVVSINGLKDTTDASGNYHINLPKETADDEQTVNFYKAPYKLKRVPIHLQTLKALDVVMEK